MLGFAFVHVGIPGTPSPDDTRCIKMYLLRFGTALYGISFWDGRGFEAKKEDEVPKESRIEVPG